MRAPRFYDRKSHLSPLSSSNQLTAVAHHCQASSMFWSRDCMTSFTTPGWQSDRSLHSFITRLTAPFTLALHLINDLRICSLVQEYDAVHDTECPYRCYETTLNSNSTQHTFSYYLFVWDNQMLFLFVSKYMSAHFLISHCAINQFALAQRTNTFLILVYIHEYNNTVPAFDIYYICI